MSDFRMDDRRVELTVIGDYTISTVRLPIDHGHSSKPLWYETMIFDNRKEYAIDLYCDRYETESEARLGHAKAIDYVHNELNKEQHENV